MNKQTSNQLADSISPYLLQHASNPVHWLPWDEQALELAFERDLPILLSIGYASCHWCHVMEHESFTDPDLAELINEHFTCIKVDREERPDLDKTYQSAHLMLTQKQGGWPLTVFLSPTLVPFFSGTYFPDKDKHGLPSFRKILARVSHVWKHQRQEVEAQNAEIVAALQSLSTSEDSQLPNLEDLHEADKRLVEHFDVTHGGIGKAPKFPQTPMLLFALRQYASGAFDDYEQGLRKSLDAMASGGLYDHVGGGFFRYCVDPTWEIPHFEKMHYDNSLLTELYAHASVVLNEPAYADVAKNTIKWMLEDLHHDKGGFYSAWDADSEGQEGKYYVWTTEQLEQTLDKKKLDLLGKHFNVTQAPNFEGAYHIQRLERNNYQTVDDELQTIISQLKTERDKRTKPTIDDKVLATANGLVANSLIKAGLYLDEPKWIEIAKKALKFTKSKMHKNGQLFTAWRNNTLTNVEAFLDDHAYLLQAQVSLLSADFNAKALNQAIEQTDTIIELFDDGQPGLPFTNCNTKQVLNTIRTGEDGPVPSGNGTIVQCLIFLGWLLNNEKYLELAEQIFKGFAKLLNRIPEHVPTLTTAAIASLKPIPMVFLTGKDDKKIKQWQQQLIKDNQYCVVLPMFDQTDLPKELTKPVPTSGVLAHVCQQTTCFEPVDSMEQLQQLITKLGANNKDG